MNDKSKIVYFPQAGGKGRVPKNVDLRLMARGLLDMYMEYALAQEEEEKANGE